MYTVTVTRSFVAQHFLTVPNPGPEGDVHSHVFEVEARLRGPELNEYGYLVDIDEVRAGLDAVEERYRDETLNHLPEFEGQNPSVEHFAEHVADRLRENCELVGAEDLCVRIWEDDEAWAAYETSLR
jgi:6-pyruvoyltetrahydropterin/6-carboxytetrahydropterin synthase